METIGKPRLLVIGGTGFIGHHLLAAAKNDWQVTSVSLNPPTQQRFVSSVRYVNVDLVDFNATKIALEEGFEYVVNLGGYIDHKLFTEGGENVIQSHFFALQNLIAALPRKSLKRFVHIGSSDEYGDSPAPQFENLREAPISPYSLAKMAGTHLLQMLCKTESFPSVILRLFLVYGPGQGEKRFLSQIVKACLRDDEFSTSEGTQIRDFCFVEDVVRAILLALQTKNIEGQVFNIASGVPVSIRSVIENVQNIVGGGRPHYGSLPYRVGENMELYADIQKAKNMLHWQPKINIEEGLKQTIRFVSANDC